MTVQKLTDRQIVYCRLRAEGDGPMYKCYEKAFKSKTSTAKSESCKLEKMPHVRAEISRLQKETETSTTLTRIEKREFIARLVRARFTGIDIDDEDDNADLVESVNHKYNNDGDHTGTTIKIGSKLSAIETDNRMSGHNAPEEVNVTTHGGVMIVPAQGNTLTDWEKAAVAQQESLKVDQSKDPTAEEQEGSEEAGASPEDMLG